MSGLINRLNDEIGETIQKMRVATGMFRQTGFEPEHIVLPGPGYTGIAHFDVHSFDAARTLIGELPPTVPTHISFLDYPIPEPSHSLFYGVTENKLIYPVFLIVDTTRYKKDHAEAYFGYYITWDAQVWQVQLEVPAALFNFESYTVLETVRRFLPNLSIKKLNTQTIHWCEDETQWNWFTKTYKFWPSSKLELSILQRVLPEKTLSLSTT